MNAAATKRCLAIIAVVLPVLVDLRKQFDLDIVVRVSRLQGNISVKTYGHKFYQKHLPLSLRLLLSTGRHLLGVCTNTEVNFVHSSKQIQHNRKY